MASIAHLDNERQKLAGKMLYNKLSQGQLQLWVGTWYVSVPIFYMYGAKYGLGLLLAPYFVCHFGRG